VRELLAELPEGPDYKIREPDGPPSTWPDALPGVLPRRVVATEQDAEAV
jgi:hypothetical protein